MNPQFANYAKKDYNKKQNKLKGGLYMGEIPEWLRPYYKPNAYTPTEEDIESLEPQSREEMLLKFLASDLSNYYTKSEVDNLIDAIPKFDIEVVQNLPVSNISPTTVYLVPSNSESSDIYKEYIYVNNNWELIGIQKIDLSDYYNKTQTDNLLNDKVDKVTGKGLSTEDYTTAEKTKLSNIEAEANKTVIVQATGSSTTSVMSQNAVTSSLGDKVDKVSGKSFSTYDYTTAEKTKLSNIEAEANKTVITQSTGSSTTSVMSQNAVTTQLNNKANKPTIETGSFGVQLTCRRDAETGFPALIIPPTYSTLYSYGYYKRIDNICFVTFAIKANISAAGTGYATVTGLPYYAMDNAGDQALAVQDISGALIDPDDNTSNLKQGVQAAIMDDTKQVNLNHRNGMVAFYWGVGIVFVCCTGFYFISE